MAKLVPTTCRHKLTGHYANPGPTTGTYISYFTYIYLPYPTGDWLALGKSARTLPDHCHKLIRLIPARFRNGALID